MKIVFWPFRMIWALIELVFKLTGRLIAAVIGLVLMIAGIILTITIVGAVAGVPLAIAGFLLLVRALF